MKNLDKAYERIVHAILFLFVIAIVVEAQHPWQKPPKRDPVEIEKIIGPVTQEQLSRNITIIWVWGVDYDHERGFHEYDWVMDLYVNHLLKKVPGISVQHVMYFPTKQQWQKANLVVFYHHAFELWETSEYDLIDSYLARGGGMLFIHESVIQRPGEALAACIGLAWGTDDSKNGRSGWGVMPTPIDLTNSGQKHPIFKGFPAEIDFVDEFYWNLCGNQENIDVLITSAAGPGGGSTGPPRKDQLDNKKWPVFWTLEKGKGKVFVSVPGHNYFTFNDPYFRIILFRAMAWVLNEPFGPFKPLVMEKLER